MIMGTQKRLINILNTGHEQETQPITTNRKIHLRIQLKETGSSSHESEKFKEFVEITLLSKSGKAKRKREKTSTPVTVPLCSPCKSSLETSRGKKHTHEREYEASEHWRSIMVLEDTQMKWCVKRVSLTSYTWILGSNHGRDTMV
jgi:hypothetical protein